MPARATVDVTSFVNPSVIGSSAPDDVVVNR
jgi:hypothetical protein